MPMLQFSKTILTYLIPMKFLILSRKLCQLARNFGKSFYKPSVISCKPKETTNLIHIYWRLLVVYCLYFGCIDFYPICCYNMPKESNTKIHTFQICHTTYLSSKFLKQSEDVWHVGHRSLNKLGYYR